VNGRHHIKKGLCQLVKGVDQLQGVLSCEAKKEIKEGIRDICQGLKELCEVLKDICCGRVCEAEKNLVCAIKLIEKGFCRIEKGLEDIYLC